MSLSPSRRCVVAGGLRLPFVRSFREYRRTTNQEMLIACIEGLAGRYGLSGKRLGDVALGAVMKSSVEWNLAREVVLGTSLHPDTPGFNVQRACGTSLEAVNLIALKIAAGQIEHGIAAGSDTNSDLPIMIKRALAWKLIDINQARSFTARLRRFSALRPADFIPAYPGITEPRTGLSMGQHTERMVQQWGITRQEQDELALESHRRAFAAYQEGFYDDLIVSFKGVSRDTIVRGDTSLEKLAKLPPVFERNEKGSLTAGNSTALSDGAAAVLLTSETYALTQGLEPMCYIRDIEAAAVDFVGGAGLLMAPTRAVANLLKRNNMNLNDFDYYEIHEAFAGQVLCTLKAWESEDYCRKHLELDRALGVLDRVRMNVMGGSLALGHPFGATGARVVATMAKLLKKKGRGTGLVTVCTAGGMGIAAILER